VGKQEFGVTGPTKHAITVPAQKKKYAPSKIKFDEISKKMSPRMKHLSKMAQKHIQNKKNAAVTRRAKAIRVEALKDGRKVYVKSATYQTKRSLKNPTLKPKTRAVSALTDRKDMMKIVKQMKVEHFNKLKLAQLEKAGKKDKFVPKSADVGKQTLVSLVKSMYGGPSKPKRVVRVTNLPAKTTVMNLKVALGRCAGYVNNIKVFSSKALKGQKVAYLYTSSEEMAQAVLRHRADKMKLSGKTPKMSLVALKRGPVSKTIRAQAKAAAQAKAKRAAKIKADNHKRHEENEKRASRRRSRRRHPMFEGPKILRDPKSHRVYGIKRNPAAKAPRVERPKVNSYKTLRAMVRATRK